MGDDSELWCDQLRRAYACDPGPDALAAALNGIRYLGARLRFVRGMWRRAAVA